MIRRCFSTVKLRNSLIGGSTILKQPKKLSWYACGPTVYDVAHIGHARTYICTDIIRRIMVLYFNIPMDFAIGITDIDDKIIKKAKSQQISDWESIRTMTDQFSGAFFQDMDDLNVMKPDTILNVTDHIDEIKMYVQQIIDNGYAYYIPNQGVYFDVGKLQGSQYYGKLAVNANTSIDDANDIPAPLVDGENIAVSADFACREVLPDHVQTQLGKKDERDFCLWKLFNQSEGTSNVGDEPFFESDWGNGRPGWHIECSAITHTYFGPQVVPCLFSHIINV